MNGSQELKNREIVPSAKAHIGKRKGEMLTQEKVRELFDYKDGQLIRRFYAQGAKLGSLAGSATNGGYYLTHVRGKRYLNHLLIWVWHYGYIPENEIDHIDQDKQNNRIENLREVGHICNLRNSKLSKRNTSGVKGVSWNKWSSNWIVSICTNSVSVFIGRYDDFAEAVAHRLASEQCLDWSECEERSPAFRFIKEFIEGKNV